MISPNLHAIWVFLLMNLSQDFKCFLFIYFGTLGDSYSLKGSCAAVISLRPRSQNILKEAQLNPEKNSRIKRARSQVSLEKSSQNYKPLDK
jgi:hypothetical protein